MGTGVLLLTIHDYVLQCNRNLCSVWFSSVSCEQIMKLNVSISDGKIFFFQFSPPSAILKHSMYVRGHNVQCVWVKVLD
jgi:hypothetical protein